MFLKLKGPCCKSTLLASVHTCSKKFIYRLWFRNWRITIKI